MKCRMAIGLIFAAALSGCATSPTGRNQLLLVSPDAAIAESRVAYFATLRQLNEQDKLLDDSALAERVEEVTGRLVAVTEARYPHTADWIWSVALIDGPETVNAWCMAGGRMAVYSGLIHELDLTDDELAQVMGHEISHAVANHTAERMSLAIASGLGLAAIAAATDSPKVLQGTALAAALAVNLPNSRVSESEADRMGIELAARAGYEPGAAVTLWRKMAAQRRWRVPEFLGTHPSPGNRGETLAALGAWMSTLKPAVPPAPHPILMLP